MLTGVVTDFSEARGLGTVTDDDGRSYLFHVIEIADGTRSIDIGRAVTFVPLARFGTVQAGHLRKV